MSGSFGTCAGLHVDGCAQVLAGDRALIPGPYAAGTDLPSVMDRRCLAGGLNLGPAMTSGYIASRPAAGTAGVLEDAQEKAV